MASTVPLTGSVLLPDGTPLPNGQLRFQLTATDSDQISREVFPDGGLRIINLVDGEIPAGTEIWRNTAGLKGSAYRIYQSWTDQDGRKQQRHVGLRTVGDAASYTYAGLIDADPPETSSVYSMTITADEYQATLTARGEAVEAAGQAAGLFAAAGGVVAAVASAEAAAAAAAADRRATAADVVTAEAAAANAQASALTCATWSVLSGLTGATAGTGAEVLDSDTGTHTDPVIGGTVANAGRYSWSVSPAGWRRIGATGLSALAADLASEADRRADADAAVAAVLTPFEATRPLLAAVTLDVDGREIGARLVGYAPVAETFEATRDDLAGLSIDIDGRAFAQDAWAARIEMFESTRDLAHILIDRAGRQVPEPMANGDYATSSQLADLDARVSVSIDSAGALRQPDYGAWAMREFRMRSRRLLSSTTGQLVLAVIGDSYTQKYDRYTGPVTEALWDAFGFAGLGYQSFGWFGGAGGPWVIGGTQPVGSDSGPTHGSPWCQTRYSGAWTTAYNSPASNMPSLSRTSSATAGNLLQITVTKAGHDAAELIYYGTGSGEIEVSWDGGASYGAPIALTGTGAQHLALTGVPAGTFVMRLRVASGSVSLGGIDFRSSGAGVRLHRLGGSGSKAEQWASVTADWHAMLAALAPNSLIIAHGTNDQGAARTAAEFRADVEAIAANVLGVLPACDVLLTTPPENNRTTNAVAMADYAAAERAAAIANGWGHLAYQEYFGPPDSYGAAYAAANPDRPWFSADLTHPEPAYPVMADALIRFLIN